MTSNAPENTESKRVREREKERERESEIDRERERESERERERERESDCQIESIYIIKNNPEGYGRGRDLSVKFPSIPNNKTVQHRCVTWLIVTTKQIVIGGGGENDTSC